MFVIALYLKIATIKSRSNMNKKGFRKVAKLETYFSIQAHKENAIER